MATAEENDVDLAVPSPFSVKIMLALVIICGLSVIDGLMSPVVWVMVLRVVMRAGANSTSDSEKLGGKDEDERSWQAVL